VRPALRARSPFALPNWMLYAVWTITLLFASGFVAGPRENFVIADFWRWCVIHMWAECFFEVFTTVIIAYFMVLAGLISRAAAGHVVFIATVLFLGSGLLGISHNFYWNAKPEPMLAIGAVFSTLQVVPLLLLALEAWRVRQLPQRRAAAAAGGAAFASPFAYGEAFLFLLAVNFWNVLGAGVFGFIINLPIVNYYEHGTYLTVNHGHAALMGVYGNLSIAAGVFCARSLLPPGAWNGPLLRVSFWSLNVGLLLMVLLDTLPVGVAQLALVLERGLAAARSEAFIQSELFQTLTWLRAVGGVLFFFGGVLPLAWFMLSRRPAPAGA
jgi:nitric oxide reductase subunit B